MQLGNVRLGKKMWILLIGLYCWNKPYAEIKIMLANKSLRHMWRCIGEFVSWLMSPVSDG